MGRKVSIWSLLVASLASMSALSLPLTPMWDETWATRTLFIGLERFCLISRIRGCLVVYALQTRETITIDSYVVSLSLRPLQSHGYCVQFSLIYCIVIIQSTWPLMYKGMIIIHTECTALRGHGAVWENLYGRGGTKGVFWNKYELRRTFLCRMHQSAVDFWLHVFVRKISVNYLCIIKL